MRRRISAALLTLCMLMSLVPSVAFAAPNGTFDDVNDHWGKDAIERWAGYGVVNGDGSGSFAPDKQMTRAEFATMLANMLGYKEKATNTFADVNDGDWFADAILKLAAAGVMQGSNGMANPNAPITRQEAAVLMCRAFNIPTTGGNLDFADSGDVADWAKGAVAALADRGMMNGVGNNNVAPLADINRASVATLLDNMITEYVTEDKIITGEVSGIVLVAGDATVTVENATLNENLIVAPKADGAEVTLTGTTTASDVVVGATATVKVESTASAGTVQVAAANSTVEVAGKADAVTVDSAANNTAVNVTESAAVGDVALNAADTKVSVAENATVSNVAVSGSNANVEVSGKVDNVTVSSGATGTGITANSGATVGKVETSANDVTVSGSGKVENVTANDGTVSVTTPGTSVENKTDSADNVTNNGKPVEPSTGGETPTPPSGGNSGGSNRPTIQDPTITVIPSDDNTALWDKNVSDLQSGLRVTASGDKTFKVSGSTKEIGTWPNWGSVSDDYFVALNITLNNGGHSDATMQVQLTDNSKKDLASGDDLVWKLAKEGANPITIIITYDKPAAPAPGEGDEGGNEPVAQAEETAKTITYTIDLTGVTKGTASAATVSNMSADTYTNGVKSLTGAPDLSQLGTAAQNISQTDNNTTTIKVTGTLDWVAGFTGFNPSDATEQYGYYLPLTLKVPGTITSSSPATIPDNGTIITVKGSKEKTFTKSDLEGTNKDEFNLIQKIQVENGKAKDFTITVDWDSTGTGYGETTYTVDMSGVTLNEGTPLTLALRSVNGPAAGDLADFDYGAAYTAWGVEMKSGNMLEVNLNTVKAKLADATPQTEPQDTGTVTAAQQMTAMTHGDKLYAGIQLEIPPEATGLYAMIGDDVVFAGTDNKGPAAIPSGTTTKDGFDFFNPGSGGQTCFIDYAPFATTSGAEVTLSDYTYRLAWFTGSEGSWKLLKVETATLTLNTIPVTSNDVE